MKDETPGSRHVHQGPLLICPCGFLEKEACFVCVMAILCCQLDYSWNELQSRRGGYTCERFSAWLEVANLFLVWTPEVGKYTPLIRTLWQEDTPLIRATFPAASLYKEHKRISLLSYSSRNTWQLRIALLTVSLALPHISRKYTTGLLMGQSGWSIFLVELSSSIKSVVSRCHNTNQHNM